MAAILYKLWRSKYGMLISILLNMLLITLLVTSYFIHENEKQLSRRETRKIGHASPIVDEDYRPDYFLFTIVLSSPGGYERRKAIRETWLKLPHPTEFKTAHMFVIGMSGLGVGDSKQLINENEKYQDLLLLKDHEDSYHSLTLKLLKTFIWISRNVKSRFILKVDDDSFVRTEILVNKLEEKKNVKRIYWGFFRGDANVKKVGQWSETGWFLCDKYLPYANGGGYVLSQDLVDYISKISDMLQIYHSEDVSVGAWLAPVLMNRVHDVTFDTEYKSRGCNNEHTISHKQSVTDMYKKYHELTVNDRLCEVEHVARLSFDYDWTVKPSQCCKRTKGIP